MDCAAVALGDRLERFRLNGVQHSIARLWFRERVFEADADTIIHAYVCVGHPLIETVILNSQTLNVAHVLYIGVFIGTFGFKHSMRFASVLVCEIIVVWSYNGFLPPRWRLVVLDSTVGRLSEPLTRSALVLDVVEIHDFVSIDLQLPVQWLLRLWAHVSLALFGLRVVHRRGVPRYPVLLFPELRLIGRDNPHLSLDLLVLELFL